GPQLPSQARQSHRVPPSRAIEFSPFWPKRPRKAQQESALSRNFSFPKKISMLFSTPRGGRFSRAAPFVKTLLTHVQFVLPTLPSFAAPREMVHNRKVNPGCPFSCQLTL